MPMEAVARTTPPSNRANAAAATATPFPQRKSLPEAMSLANTPRGAFENDVSVAETSDAASAFTSLTASQMSLLDCSPTAAAKKGRKEEGVRIPPAPPMKVRDDAEKSAISTAGAAVVAIASTPAPNGKIQSPLRNKTQQTQRHGGAAVASATGAVVAPALTSPVTSPSKRKQQLATAKGSGRDATSTLSSFRPLNSDFGKPPSDLLSLQTTSAVNTQPSSTSPKVQHHKQQKEQPQDRSDLSTAARANPHLSVLADLLDHKVFTEEDVLLELEAIRQRTLLTTAPFKKHLLPILAWYLLRDRFGPEAASRYVEFLTCPPGTPRPDGGVNTTAHIASFLPRVNAMRRERRATKERQRKSPTHHYAITPPQSPSEAGTLSSQGSGRLSRRRRRCTPAYDALEEASDIPSTWLSSPRTPASVCTPSAASPASFPRDRLHLYTKEQAVADRRLARAEDRSIVDVVVDAVATKGRAKNVYAVVEASIDGSALPEPSIFQPPLQQEQKARMAPQRKKKDAAAVPSTATTTKKTMPAPLSLMQVTGSIEDGGDASEQLLGFSSMPPVSAVGIAPEEGLSTFYHDNEGAGLCGVSRGGSTSLAREGEPPRTMKDAESKKAVAMRQRLEREKSQTVAGGTLDISDIPCVRDDGVSAQSGFAAEGVGEESVGPYSYLEAPNGPVQAKKTKAAVPAAAVAKPSEPSSSVVSDARGESSQMLYSALPGPEGSTRSPHSARGDAINPYYTGETSLFRTTSLTQGRQHHDQPDTTVDDTGDTSNDAPQFSTLLDLSTSRTANAADVYSMLPDASMATQKPPASSSTPATPSVDHRKEGYETEEEEGSRELLSGTRPGGALQESTQLPSGYGSLFPTETVLENRSAVAVDASVAMHDGNDYTAFHSTRTTTNKASQLQVPSLFASPDTSAQNNGDMSAAAFSMFEQGSASPSQQPSSRKTAHSSRNGSASGVVDELPYSAFLSARESANTTRRSECMPYSAFGSSIDTFHAGASANSQQSAATTTNTTTAVSGNASALAFGSVLDASSGKFVHRRPASARPAGYSRLLPRTAVTASASSGRHPSRASVPSLLEASSQLPQTQSQSSTGYGSLMEASAMQPTPIAARHSRRTSRTPRTCSTHSTRRSLSGTFRASLRHPSTSSSNEDRMSNSYGSMMTGSRHTSRSSSRRPTPNSLLHHHCGYGSMLDGPSGVRNVNASAAGGASNGGYGSMLDGPSGVRSVNASAAGGASNGGYGSMLDGPSGVRSVNASAAGGASNGGYGSMLDGPSGVRSVNASAAGGASNGGYGSMLDGPSGVRSVNASAAGGASNGGYGSMLDGPSGVRSVNASAAGGASNGGYGSMLDGPSGVRSVNASAAGGASNGGYGSMLDGPSGVRSVNASAAGGASNGGYGSMLDGPSGVRSVNASAAGGASNGGYGSMLDGPSGVRSVNASAAGGASNGGYGSMLDGPSGVRSVNASAAGGASNGGYGSMLDGPSGVRSVNASAAGGASNGGYGSMLDGPSGVRSVNASAAGGASNGGYGSMLDGPSGVRSVNASAAGGASNGGYGSMLDGNGSIQPFNAGRSNGGYSVLDTRNGEDRRLEMSGEGQRTTTDKLHEESRTDSLYNYSKWNSTTNSSAVDPEELKEVMKRLDRPVSGLRENKACTFGDDGCRCAHGDRPVHSLHLGGGSAKKAAVKTAAPDAELSPVPAAPLQQRDINKLPLVNATQEKKRQALPVRSATRVEGTPVRKGTGFNKPSSPQPSLSSPSTAASGSTPSPPRRGHHNNTSQQASLLDADAHMSRVTIISDPRSSKDISIHNLPDLSVIEAETVESEKKTAVEGEQQFSAQHHCDQSQRRSGPNSSNLADHSRAFSLLAPLSILNTSTPPAPTAPAAAAASAVAGDAPKGAIESRLSPTPSNNRAIGAADKKQTNMAEGVSVVGGLSVLTGVPTTTTKRETPFPATVVGAPQKTTEGDDVSMRMPHNMTAVLFDGRARLEPADTTTAVVSVPPPEAEEEEEEKVSACSRRVRPDVLRAKHANLAVILASSRLEGSNIIEGHTTIAEPHSYAHPAETSRVCGADFRRHSLEQRSVSRTHNHDDSTAMSSSSSPSASSVSDSSNDETDATMSTRHPPPPANQAEVSSYVAVAAPRRPVRMQPQPTDPESPEQRELRQRHRTILDVPDVPYVPSPDISTHIDKTEARVKEQRHEAFIMAWARRGLAWQREERDAQMKEEYIARLQAGQLVGSPVMHYPPPQHVRGGGGGVNAIQHPMSPQRQQQQRPRNGPPYQRGGAPPMGGRPPMHPPRPAF